MASLIEGVHPVPGRSEEGSNAIPEPGVRRQPMSEKELGTYWFGGRIESTNGKRNPEVAISLLARGSSSTIMQLIILMGFLA